MTRMFRSRRLSREENVESSYTRLWFWCARRDGYRASERIGAMVQLVNHTDVVSVQDLEALISEARHLASEEDAGTVPADLGGNLARTTGSGGEAT